MKLTVQQVFDAYQVLQAIVNGHRPLPQKGAYRVSRMKAKLDAEFTSISQRRDALLDQHAIAVEGAPGNYTVTPEFTAAWKDFASDEIEVAVEPIPLALIDLGDSVPGAITVGELSVLGDLVAE